MPVLYYYQLKDVLSSPVLQQPSPEHSDLEPDELEEEEEEPEQKTAYQKLLSTLSQPTSNDQSEEESSEEEEEEEEELLGEGGLFYYQHTEGSIGQNTELQSQLNIVVLFILGDSDGVGDDSEDGDADEGGEEEPEDVDETLTEAVEGEEKEVGGEEFVDKEHESQFCLETNFMDEEGQEDTESTAEHKDSKGTKRVKATGNPSPQ